MKEIKKDEIIFNSKCVKKRSKRLLSDLDDLDSPITLTSSLIKDKDEEKKKNKEKESEYSDIDDEWMETLTSFKAPKTKKKTKFSFDKMVNSGKKGKKKKNKDDKKEIDHKKEFEPEMALLRNLQMEQSKFVDSLQKKYNQMENTKSTARGVGKFTTDMIESITGARSLSMQLVDKIISVKKTIADLNFKERKEFGKNSNSEQENLTNYASTYLKQMMAVGRNNVVGQQEGYSSFDDLQDDETDDLFSSIDESLGDVERSEDVDKYLKYENDNVEIEVNWYDGVDDDSENKYEFVAYNKHGEVVDDYPLPLKTKLNINRSTNIAIDIYGNKYKLNVK